MGLRVAAVSPGMEAAGFFTLLLNVGTVILDITLCKKEHSIPLSHGGATSHENLIRSWAGRRIDYSIHSRQFATHQPLGRDRL